MSTPTNVDATPAAPATPAKAKRWHDLDALRGFAMLLGIALHASLSFFPGFWVVIDSTADSDNWFDEFFHAVHGFRMPLFFLLSGFFTMMLWRRRGPGRLIEQRLKRIALPLAIFFLPMGLIMNWTVHHAIETGIDDLLEESEDVWAAVVLGNEDAVERLLDGGVDVNIQDWDENGLTPLHLAAFNDDVEMVEFLLAHGADPNIAAGDGRPIDYAAFVGSTETADALVVAGSVDPRPAGTAWTDLDYWAIGAAEAEETRAEWDLDPWVGTGWLNELNHLWFLWFLLWMVAGFLVVAGAADRFFPERSTPAVWTGVVMWALIPLTLLPQLQMGNGGEHRVFGPDTSTQWIPEWHVLAYYAVFFAFGALLYGRPNRRGGQLVESIGRWWPALVPVTAVVFAVALDLTFDEGASWTAASIGQVAFAWLAIITPMGLFRTLLATERRGVRYLSDSAYWLYLAHLPIVIWGQVWIRNWDLPAAVKFVGLTTAIIVLLLISYQLFVRYTPIGTLLNGKRTRPSKQPASTEPTPASSTATT